MLLRRKVHDTLDTTSHPHILQIFAIRANNVVELQGRVGLRVCHKKNLISHCALPIKHSKVDASRFYIWEQAFRHLCGSTKDTAHTVLCDNCNDGYHTYRMDSLFSSMLVTKWYCKRHISHHLNDLAP